MNNTDRSIALLGLAAIATVGHGARGVQAACSPIIHQHFGYQGRFFQDERLAKDSSMLANTFSHVIYVDTLDLDCDGQLDVAAQGVALPGPSPGRLVFQVWVRRGADWKPVLRSVSPVDGPEKIAIAAPLTSSQRRDLIVIGADEGGYVPRAFRWMGDSMVSVDVPPEYQLRNEPDWDATCARKRNPRLVGRSEIALLRETISPSSTRTHGESCALPIDTLHIVGTHLMRVHP